MNFSEFVAEAGRRGFTVGTCNLLLEPRDSPGFGPLLITIILTGTALTFVWLVWLIIIKTHTGNAGKSVEVEAPDEAAARTMSDYKTDVLATTPTENPNSGATTTSWWYVSNNERKGPISDENLRQLLIDGTLSPNSLIWKKGKKDWQRVGQIGDFAPLLSSLPPEIPQSRLGTEIPQSRSGTEIPQTRSETQAGIRIRGHLGSSISFLLGCFAVLAGLAGIAQTLNGPGARKVDVQRLDGPRWGKRRWLRVLRRSNLGRIVAYIQMLDY